MQHAARIETTITGPAARLYELLGEATSTLRPGEVNKALLETGLVHHVLMLRSLGLIDGTKLEEVDQAIGDIAETTIMSELFDMARAYWDQQDTMELPDNAQ